jgi:manganese/zinc/iron transport system substrate-binding protein
MRLFLNTSRRWAVLSLALVLTAVTACGSAAFGDDERLRVVATTGMITDAAQRIGGDRVQVAGLMGPGVDPHLYKARESDVRRLHRAHLVLYNGLHLEAKLTDVLADMRGGARTVAVGEAVDTTLLLRPAEFEGAWDPHIWFDVRLWMAAVGRVRDALVESDSAGGDYYRANAELYLSELAELDSYVREQARRVPVGQRVLVTAHDAFNYFGRAYDFEVRGLQGISTASEAGTADVRQLADFIAERRIPALFVETSVPRRTIEAVQAAVRSRGFDVRIGGELYSDALGSPGSAADNYIGMVRHNIDVIVGALLEPPAVAAGSAHR